MKNYTQHGRFLLRIGMALVFLWFGISQITNANLFISWLPLWAQQLSNPTLFVMLNGVFEIIFGLLLITGLFTRISAVILGFHLVGIITSIGYNDVGVRDFGLMLATFSIALMGPDEWSLDRMWRKR